MSSDISALEQELISNYINTSVDGLFLFDCLITLSQEVDVIWKRKWNITTWLYAFTRYSLVINVLVLLLLPAFVSCEVGVYINQALLLIQYLCLAWFSALRVYALLDGKYLVPALVLLLNVVPFATNIFNFATSVMIINAEECADVPGLSKDLMLSFSLATRISVIIGDVLVLAFTWTKTAQAYQESRRLSIRAPLASMLFRDGTMKGLIVLFPLPLLIKIFTGTIYFLILLVLNILQMIEDNIPDLLSISIIDPFSHIIPPMIVCHFILNLRQIKPAGSSWASATQSHSLRFVGNMGQSLQFGDEDANGEDEDMPGVEGTAAEAGVSSWPEITVEAAKEPQVNGEYVRPYYDAEQELPYANV